MNLDAVTQKQTYEHLAFDKYAALPLGRKRYRRGYKSIKILSRELAREHGFSIHSRAGSHSFNADMFSVDDKMAQRGRIQTFIAYQAQPGVHHYMPPLEGLPGQLQAQTTGHNPQSSL